MEHLGLVRSAAWPAWAGNDWMWSKAELGQARTHWASLHPSTTVSDCEKDFLRTLTAASVCLPNLMQVSPLADSNQLPRQKEILAPHLTKVTTAQSSTTMGNIEIVTASQMLKDLQHIQ